MKRESIVCGQHSKNFLNGVASQLMFLEVEVGSSEARSGIHTPRRLGAIERGLLLVMVSLSLMIHNPSDITLSLAIPLTN